jgi:hypothetical protein
MAHHQDPRTNAQTVAAKNTTDGHSAVLSAVVVGNYGDGGFKETTPHNAVKADTEVEVVNLLAGVVGRPKSTVVRSAVAAFETLSTSQPGFPIALASCYFDTSPCTADGCLASLTQVPNGSNSYWAGLDDLSQTQNVNKSFSEFLPAACGGSGTTAPTLTAGTSDVYLTNGQVSNNLDALKNCVGQKFLIPVVQGCGGLSGHIEVVGFATIRLDQVNASGKNQSIGVTVLFNPDVEGTVGTLCPYCGTGRVALVR